MIKVKVWTICCNNGDGSVRIKFFSNEEDAAKAALQEEEAGESFTEQPNSYILSINEITGHLINS